MPTMFVETDTSPLFKELRHRTSIPVPPHVGEVASLAAQLEIMRPAVAGTHGGNCVASKKIGGRLAAVEVS